MIRRKEETEITIDIDGQDGNAFVILGIAQKLARDIGWEPQPILEEMQSGDYHNLLKVFNKYFPMVVLETANEKILEALEVD